MRTRAAVEADLASHTNAAGKLDANANDRITMELRLDLREVMSSIDARSKASGKAYAEQTNAGIPP